MHKTEIENALGTIRSKLQAILIYAEMGANPYCDRCEANVKQIAEQLRAQEAYTDELLKKALELPQVESAVVGHLCER